MRLSDLCRKYPEEIFLDGGSWIREISPDFRFFRSVFSTHGKEKPVLSLLHPVVTTSASYFSRILVTECFYNR